MACSDSVNIQAFHNFYILNHTFWRHDIATVGIDFVPVGTFNEYRLAVDKQLSILYFNLTEAHFLRYYLNDISLTVFNNSLKRIEIRRFGRPRFDVSEREMRYTLVQFTKVSYRFYDDIAIGIQQLKLDGRVAFYTNFNS